MSIPINIIALFGLVLTTFALLIPTDYDVELGITKQNFNYAPVVLICFYILIMIFWFLPKYGARHHFKGPKIPKIIYSINDISINSI